MSKLQVGDNSLVDIANMTLANQLESRLKELERNIAVARQFIGMADECYSKVKHEWELLQQDIGVKNATTHQTQLPSSSDTIDESEVRGTARREKNSRSESQRKKAEDSPDTFPGPEDHAEFAKDGKSSRKQSETFSQDFKHGKRSKASLKKIQ